MPKIDRGAAEARDLRTNLMGAAHGEVAPAAEAVSLDHGDGRLGIGGHARVHLLGGGVVALHGVPRGALVLELGDVGARHEGLPSCPGEDHDPDLVVGGEALEDLRGGLPHLERDGVVPLGVVEDHRSDAPFLAGEHLVASLHAALPQITLSRRSFSISASEKPNSRSTSAVCSPRPGGGATTRLGVRLKVTGWPTTRSLPPAVAILRTMPRCSTCGSAKTLSIEWMGPQGTPASLSRSTQSLLVRPAR